MILNTGISRVHSTPMVLPAKKRIQVICNNVTVQKNHSEALSSMWSWGHKDNMVNEFVPAQWSPQQGLDECRDQGKAAATKEMRQMLSGEVSGEIDCQTLSREDEQNTLATLLSPAMKQDGTTEGRA